MSACASSSRSKLGYLYEFGIYLGKKGNTEFGLGESVLSSLKDTYSYVYFDNFFMGPILIGKLLENGISGIGAVRENHKQTPSLKGDKQVKCGKNDW